MSVWRSPIPNKLPIVPKKEGAPAGEKTGDGRENGEGKVQGAVKSAEGKKHRPANGPIFRGIFSAHRCPPAHICTRKRTRIPGNSPSPAFTVGRKGIPGFFAEKRPCASFGKCVRAGRGNRELRFGRGKRALSRIFGIRAVSVSAAGVGVLAAGCNRFHFSVRQWIFGAPRQNRADPRNPQSSRAPAAWDLEAGSRKSRGRKLYLLPYRPLFSPAKPAKGRTREPAEGAAGDRKTKIGGTRDRRSNFAVFQIPFVPGIDKIGGKGAFFLADPIGERGDVVF